VAGIERFAQLANMLGGELAVERVLSASILHVKHMPHFMTDVELTPHAA
jgi:hypothetical protein